MCARVYEREREEGRREREGETRAKMRNVEKERLERIYTVVGWRVLKLCINIFINTNKNVQGVPEERERVKEIILFSRKTYIF